MGTRSFLVSLQSIQFAPKILGKQPGACLALPRSHLGRLGGYTTVPRDPKKHVIGSTSRSRWKTEYAIKNLLLISHSYTRIRGNITEDSMYNSCRIGDRCHVVSTCWRCRYYCIGRVEYWMHCGQTPMEWTWNGVYCTVPDLQCFRDHMLCYPPSQNISWWLRHPASLRAPTSPRISSWPPVPKQFRRVQSCGLCDLSLTTANGNLPTRTHQNWVTPILGGDNFWSKSRPHTNQTQRQESAPSNKGIYLSGSADWWNG